MSKDKYYENVIVVLFESNYKRNKHYFDRLNIKFHQRMSMVGMEGAEKEKFCVFKATKIKHSLLINMSSKRGTGKTKLERCAFSGCLVDSRLLMSLPDKNYHKELFDLLGLDTPKVFKGLFKEYPTSYLFKDISNRTFTKSDFINSSPSIRSFYDVSRRSKKVFLEAYSNLNYHRSWLKQQGLNEETIKSVISVPLIYVHNTSCHVPGSASEERDTNIVPDFVPKREEGMVIDDKSWKYVPKKVTSVQKDFYTRPDTKEKDIIKNHIVVPSKREHPWRESFLDTYASAVIPVKTRTVYKKYGETCRVVKNIELTPNRLDLVPFVIEDTSGQLFLDGMYTFEMYLKNKDNIQFSTTLIITRRKNKELHKIFLEIPLLNSSKPIHIREDYEDVDEDLGKAPRNIVNYSYNPSSNFPPFASLRSERLDNKDTLGTPHKGRNKRGLPYLGIEIELDPCSDEYSISRESMFSMFKKIDLGSKFAVASRDASLSSEGMEIKTIPMTLPFIKHHRLAKGYEKICSSKEYRWSSKGGMHVHISRDSFSKMGMGKFYTFIHNKHNRKFIETIAGRKNSGYFSYNSSESSLKRMANVSSKGTTTIRKAAVNVSSRHPTLEVRVFATPENGYELMARLEFVKALHEFCHYTGIRDNNVDGFIEFMKRPNVRSCYPNIYKMMVNKNIMDKEPSKYERLYVDSKIKPKPKVRVSARSRRETQ